jgi:hypothetical protein
MLDKTSLLILKQIEKAGFIIAITPKIISD